MNSIFKISVRPLALMAVITPMCSYAGEVISNPSVSLSTDEVREVYLGEKQLAGDLKLVPVDNSAQQAEFLAKVLKTDAVQYSSRWIKKSFREGLTAPAAKGSDAEVIAFVKSTPGALGYVGAAVTGVKILQKY